MVKFFDGWNWTETYSGRDELQACFNHVDKVWDLSRDISFNSRVSAAHWQNDSKERTVQVGGFNPHVKRTQSIIFCTGFALKPYTPAYPGLNKFKGLMLHTAEWPQEGVDMKDKRVAVIGTGASGVQVIQEAGAVASHLTVIQRTPNMALPMGQERVDEAHNKQLKVEHQKYWDLIHSTYSENLYEFDKGEALKTPKEVREVFYDRIYGRGGLNFWQGTYSDVLYKQAANDTVSRRECLRQSRQNQKEAQ